MCFAQQVELRDSPPTMQTGRRSSRGGDADASSGALASRHAFSQCARKSLSLLRVSLFVCCRCCVEFHCLCFVRAPRSMAFAQRLSSHCNAHTHTCTHAHAQIGLGGWRSHCRRCSVGQHALCSQVSRRCRLDQSVGTLAHCAAHSQRGALQVSVQQRIVSVCVFTEVTNYCVVFLLFVFFLFGFSLLQ